MAVYIPSEDSFLLQIEVKAYAKGRVLDMGTGAGIQALTAATCKKVKSVLGVDVDEGSIQHCLEKIRNRKVSFAVSDLFSNVKGKFDTIIFNPPYLPADNYKRDISVIGGKKGYETIERFFEEAHKHLNENGIILLLFSSRTGKDKVNEIIENNAFEYEKLQEKGVGLMEKLYVYLVRKTGILKKLDKLGVRNIRKHTKGHRGIIYAGRFRGKKVAAKAQRADVEVKSIHNEIKCLKKLQDYEIGPKLVYAGRDFFVYDFIEGKFIEEFVERERAKKRIREIFRNVMLQCRQLDKLMLNKEEMHNPYKHIIVTRQGKPVLVDFERCKKTEDPKNVTQFCQYLSHGRMAHILEKKGILIDKEEMKRAAKEYKGKFDEKSFRKIVELIK